MPVSKIDELLMDLEEASLSAAAETLRAALRAKDQFPHRRLALIMREADLPVGETSIRRWRKSHGV